MNEPLAEREIEILRLAADGFSNGEIAARLALSLHTVKWYTKRIYEKLAVENRTQAVKRAQTLGLLTAHNQPAKVASPRHNLPSSLTTFVGRRGEVDDVKQLLKQHRLLTLTGPGGIGKTRLALRVAEEMSGFFPDGICFVDLSSISEATLVTNTIAHLLGVPATLDTPPLTLIQTALRDKQFLLVLDNFEHLLDGAPIVAELLAACHGLSALITSREVLAIYGEQEYAVPPLKLPDIEWFATNHLAVDKLLNSESLQLFEHFARFINPTFRLTQENAPAIASICLRLDGLPLAIELAAAYVKVLSPQIMLTQLDSLWLEMKRSLRNIPTRQQTLRNTIEWSYRFLNEEERRLFAQLSVFRGGCTWEAISAVCGEHPTPTPTVVLLDALNGLVNKSLVWRKTSGGDPPRFGMLETIREFAQGCLEERGETAQLQEEHAQYYTLFTGRIDTEMSIRQRQALNQLESEVDNFRAALRWALNQDPELGLRMISDLSVYWRIRGYSIEGMNWAEQLFAVKKSVSLEVLAKAYANTALLALVLGHRLQARQFANDAWELAQSAQDARTRAITLHARVNTQVAPDLSFDEYQKLIQMGEEAAQLYLECENRLGYARIFNTLGEINRMQRRYAEAQPYYEESLRELRAVGWQSGVTRNLLNLGWTAFHRHAHTAAYTYFMEAILIASELDYLRNFSLGLSGVAGVLSRWQHPKEAARLLGKSDALRETIGAAIDVSDEADYAQTRAELELQLGKADFDMCWQEGRLLTVEAAVTLVKELRQ